MQDNHLHSQFSFDSQENLEGYLEQFDGQIVTTEHFDLSNPYTQKDDVPDYEAYCQEVARLNALYGNRLRKGIEIGYYHPREKDILTYLADKNFDLKLLSIHHNGSYDYLQEEALAEDWQEVVSEYLDRLYHAIGRVEADVLAHFDYGFRKRQLKVSDLALYEDKLLAIFKKMLEHKLAFEINTKSMYLYGNEELHRYVLSLLQRFDEVTYSIGSDGHHLEHFRIGFDRVETLLESFQIRPTSLLIIT